MKLWMLIPVLGAAAVMTVLLLGLNRDDVQTLPSALIDKSVPEFALDGLDGGDGLSTADLQGPGVKLINVWASWCVPCRAEHPNIEALAADGTIIHGMNYKDEPANARAFLDELGNPYTRIGADVTGRTGIEFGVYGVPETYVVDGAGRIVHKHTGPILQRHMEAVRAAIKEAER
ncbi:MAG: DsbE family thiol:disulfide interchange protein [Pseudomonadota bacterium]